MNHETNDFLRADVYKDLSSSLAGSLHSILGSRKNSFVLEVQPAAPSSESDSDASTDSSDQDSEPEEKTEYRPVPLTEDKTEQLRQLEARLGLLPAAYLDTAGVAHPMTDVETPRDILPDSVINNTSQNQQPAYSVNNLSFTMENGKVKLCSGAVVVFLVCVVAIALSSLHRIEEGNVGVYYRNGALMEATAFPGIHYMAPFIVEVVEITIRPETDSLDPITSITKDGITNTFNDVQVITSIKMDKLVYMLKNYGPRFKKALVFDRIKEELRIFCANSTIDEVYNTKFLDIVAQVRENVIDSIERLGKGGITLMNLVIPKPNIPNDIAANYKRVKVQWTEQLVATQQQKTEAIKKETEKLRAIADAERNKAVLEIKIQERILEKEGDANISALNNDILKQKEENIANIEKYKILSEASANKELYTPEYIQYNTAKHLSNNTKYYFSGQESLLGGVLTKIFN